MHMARARLRFDNASVAAGAWSRGAEGRGGKRGRGASGRGKPRVPWACVGRCTAGGLPLLRAGCPLGFVSPGGMMLFLPRPRPVVGAPKACDRGAHI